MSSPLADKNFCLEGTVIEENYDILRKICKKYGMKSYIWFSVNSISIYPEGVEFNNLSSLQVLPISKINLVNPDWEEIENFILTHSLSVTF